MTYNTTNPAIEALRRAVNAAIETGGPTYVEQRPLLNSFQTWAIDYAAQQGFTAEPMANWVRMGMTPIMTRQGVIAFCDQAKECSA